MSYEVQFQHEGAEYTVRGPDIDGVLRLIQGVQGLPTGDSAQAKLQWVEWPGGGCPVPPGVVVAIQHRLGSQTRGEAQTFDWSHNARAGDIVRYRVCE